MPNSVISTKAAPAAIGPYSQGIKSQGLLFCSGQIAIDPATGAIVEGGIEAQTKRVCENVMALLKEAGVEPSSVVKTTVFITDMNDFPKVNEIYAGYFAEPFPARSCVGVASLPKGALVEIEVVASLG
ncbi:MAG: RidA family protein [Desulfovibrio sp.]|nr:RidA family protein [Desulfovibrio sp.]